MNNFKLLCVFVSFLLPCTLCGRSSLDTLVDKLARRAVSSARLMDEQNGGSAHAASIQSLLLPALSAAQDRISAILPRSVFFNSTCTDDVSGVPAFADENPAHARPTLTAPPHAWGNTFFQAMDTSLLLLESSFFQQHQYHQHGATSEAADFEEKDAGLRMRWRDVFLYSSMGALLSSLLILLESTLGYITSMRCVGAT
jgi:hypothetical protein